MPGKFTQSAQIALNKSVYYARRLGHTYIGSEHLLLALISEEDSVAAKILTARGASFDSVRDAVIEIAGTGEETDVGPSAMTPRTKRVIESSAFEAMKYGQNYIGTEHLLLALCSEKDSVAVRILSSEGISADDLRSDTVSFFEGFSAPGEPSRPDDPSSSGDFSGSSRAHAGERGPSRGRAGTGQGGNGKDNTLSAFPTLKQYGRDLTALAKSGKTDPIIGRDAETERVIQILSRRTKNNPCLIGEPGVGKTAVVEGLAQRIADGSVPETLAGKSVVTLDISSMIAGAKYRGEFEERLKGVMGEIAKNPDVILFIDEIHTIIGAGAAEGAVDAANIIKPALARGEMQLIGATTIDEYRRHIEKDAALERRFQPVMIGEPSPEEAVLILKGLRDKYEAFHKVKITDGAIDAAVKYSRRYITDRYLPDKALDLIDEAASKLRIGSLSSPPDLRALEEKCRALGAEKEEAVRAQDFEKAARLRDEEKKAKDECEAERQRWKKEKTDSSLSIGESEIADIVTSWTGIPVKKLADEEGQRLLNLDSILKERIIGQDEAVSAVARAIRRGRVGLKDPKRPVGSFIFSGPTGVGKTELTKALAEVLFGDENAMIRVDMSEYMEKHSVSKMIGSPPGYVGYDEGGQLTEKVRRRPYSVILFDEIEKAHPDVFNVMLQILDDGMLTDAQGRRVDFKNTVIIMTSNVGASEITRQSSALGFSASQSAAEDESKRISSAVMNRLRDTFRPEFLNRVDEIIVFSKLGDAEIRRIASIMLGEIGKRVSSMGIDLTFGDDVVALMAKEGVDPVYGARPLRREIQRRIEDSFSTELLEGRFTAGDRVTASVGEDGTIVYRKADEEGTVETVGQSDACEE